MAGWATLYLIRILQASSSTKIGESAPVWVGNLHYLRPSPNPWSNTRKVVASISHHCLRTVDHYAQYSTCTEFVWNDIYLVRVAGHHVVGRLFNVTLPVPAPVKSDYPVCVPSGKLRIVVKRNREACTELVVIWGVSVRLSYLSRLHRHLMR